VRRTPRWRSENLQDAHAPTIALTWLPDRKLSLLVLHSGREPQKAGEVYQIHIKINSAKTKAGEFKGTIRIDTNDPDMPVIEVPVQVSFK